MSKESIREEINNFARSLLEARLAQITEDQRTFFNRIYPKGVPAKALISAIDLCDRTIKENKEKIDEYSSEKH